MLCSFDSCLLLLLLDPVQINIFACDVLKILLS